MMLAAVLLQCSLIIRFVMLAAMLLWLQWLLLQRPISLWLRVLLLLLLLFLLLLLLCSIKALQLRVVLLLLLLCILLLLSCRVLLSWQVVELGGCGGGGCSRGHRRADADGAAGVAVAPSGATPA